MCVSFPDYFLSPKKVECVFSPFLKNSRSLNLSLAPLHFHIRSVFLFPFSPLQPRLLCLSFCSQIFLTTARGIHFRQTLSHGRIDVQLNIITDILKW